MAVPVMKSKDRLKATAAAVRTMRKPRLSDVTASTYCRRRLRATMLCAAMMRRKDF